MRRVVRALRLGDSDNLSDNYWKLHNGICDKKFNMLETDELITALKENELVYLYWELVHTKPINSNWVKMNIWYLKERLLDDFMDRKYKRGKYKNG